ncbi:YLP motif-containing protein 1 [Amphibalanus amphitrite]|uniref:YLP motif-containing protein 1 n=1 Tax=Amphibalanus amphitrite TaxID=1232801 RepID=A0A6A4WF58_AMPAM|nr:YLP motif-containing protein 1 [Amphibalanus amphitrite]
MDMDVATCHKRNIHGRSLDDIREVVKNWQPTPRHYIRVDVRPVLQDDSIQEFNTISSVARSPVLEVTDPEPQRWLARRLPRSAPPLHLLIGDSVARDAGIRSRLNRHQFLSLARGGATWSSTADELHAILDRWTSEAERQGRRLGEAVVWLTGDDVYSRSATLAVFDKTLEETGRLAKAVCRRLQSLARVTVLGPLPRLSEETSGNGWETTAAYHQERRLKHSLPPGVHLVLLGRQLMRRSARRYRFAPECASYFRSDGVHLSAEGYGRVADALELPIWLAMTAACEDL